MERKLLLLVVSLLCAAGIQAQDFTSGYLMYSVTDADKKLVSVTGYTDELPAEAEVPATVSYEGIDYAVTAIGDFAFWNSSTLVQITIGNNVQSIGDQAFSQCGELRQITFPNGLITIGDYAFSFCPLTQVAIPESVTTIGDYAFSWCHSITEITIPEGVTTIGEGVFWSSSGLTQITIPASVTTIGMAVCASCASLKEINVAEDNQNYCSVNGVLYSKDLTLLLQYPSGRLDTAYDIPNSVTIIGDSAFDGCAALEQIAIGNSVAIINKYAFSYCEALKQITLPEGVTTIGNGAFSNCSAFEQITVLTSTPPTLEDTEMFPFNGVDNAIPVIVPDGSLEAYRASGWSYFTNMRTESGSSVQQPTLVEGVRYADGQLLNPQQLLVSVYDLTGRLVYRGNDSACAFPGGVYIVSYGRTTEKMVF